MKIVLRFGIACVAAASTCCAYAALPGNAQEGKKLHDQHCKSCHDSSVYTRKDHQVKSMAALNEQLDACTHMANASFTDVERQNLVKYLNETFYKLK